MIRQLWKGAAVLTLLAVLALMSGCKQTVTVPEAKDTTAPAEVTELKAEAFIGAVRLTWTDPANADLWGIEISSEQVIVGRAVSLIPEKSFIVAKGQQSIKIANLTAGQPYTFTVKTIDRSGNKSTGQKTEAKSLLPESR